VTPSFVDRLLTWRGLTVALLGLSLLAWGGRALADLRARAVSPTGEAEWIWQERNRRDVSPAAFLAARDFYLESVPVRARLLVAADEEYLLSLNNHPVGRGGSPYRGQPDLYDVTPLLQSGGNRLVAELRNGRGQGGFLLRLDDAAGRPLVVSDGEWRVFNRCSFGLERGWLPLDQGDRPQVWGVPPLGRWGLPGAAHGKPLGLAFAAESRLAPLSAQPRALSALPGGTAVPGAGVLLDFGRETTGYLTLERPAAEELAVGLLWVGLEPPDPFSSRPAGTVLLMPGRGSWSDAHPRRFRYALVVGLGQPTGASLAPLPGGTGTAPADLDVSVAKIEGRGGVFGVVPPPLRAPVEDEVWRKLQRLAGGGGREKL
jgi:hypothetical protein